MVQFFFFSVTPPGRLSLAPHRKHARSDLEREKKKVSLHSKEGVELRKDSDCVPANSVSEDSLLEFSKVSRLLLEVLGK